MNDIEIDRLIDSAIDALADDSITHGADSLVQLASVWARAGLSQDSFMNMRKYIIESAKKKTDTIFIDEKLRIQERNLYASRCH